MRQVWLWRPGTIWKGGGVEGRDGAFRFGESVESEKKEERGRGRREMISLGGAILS